MSIEVGAVMSRNVVSASPGDTAINVARQLSTHGISAVPVVDRDGTLLGIVSEGDLMRPFGLAHSLQREWWLGLLAEGTDLAPAFADYIRHDLRPVRDLMSATVHTVTEHATLPEVADIMLRHHIKRLPVLRDGKVVGIVSRADLVRSFLGVPAPASALAKLP